MSVVISETGTKVMVKADDSGLEAVKNAIESDPILSQVLAPAVQQIEKDKQLLKDGANNLAEATSEQIRSYQEEYIRANGSIDTSLMVDTIFVEPDGEASYLVGATALSEYGFPYPVVVDGGSDPHVIEGNPYLFWEGANHPVRSVMHPGTKPRPFVQPSLESAKSDMDSMFNVEIINNLGS